MSSINHVQLPISRGDVDLRTILGIIGQQRKFIAAVTALVVLAALVYCFLAPAQYQVSSVLRPAAINELDALNRSEIYKLPPNEALSKVGASLESYETRLGFFRANQSLFQRFERTGHSLEQSFEEFNRNSISLKLPDPKKAGPLSSYIALELKYPAGVDGVAILNGFVDYAIAVEREEVAADLKVIVKNRLNELKGKIDSARSNYETEKTAKIASLLEADGLKRAQLQDELKGLRQQLKTERNDRMAQLSEAISIADSLGIKKPTTPSALADGERTGSASVMRTEVNNQQIPLYFMGVEALEAERKALQHRTSDDFTVTRVAQIAKELMLLQENRQVEILSQRKNEDIFLNNVQPLRAEMARLSNLNIDISRIKLVTVDRQALAPIAPVEPRKGVIIVLSILLGFALGLILSFIRHLAGARRSLVLGSTTMFYESELNEGSLGVDVKSLKAADTPDTTLRAQ
ncbi:chain-length determining protein [Pseudomonas sp. TH39(2020)]|uniref:Wzz/FepE/Etk N-terminal domain-containing protein n=1 Tax=Pseudomonas sp. TH39(2020) TaxID=2796349 RepID=UPI0019112693|nr:Wzz/FepE/Etk N-terminal domain-containing protein [Pseudomonas sp. TH39(2020)]MBK5400139.1 chain-length determining protein [Pseudomonas sp. TH39(2020)]